jgi:hypothetical protein
MPPCYVSQGFIEKAKLPFLCTSKRALLMRVCDRKMLVHGAHANTRIFRGIQKKVYLLSKEFKICAVHAVDNSKLRVNFEVIVLQVGLDISQNMEVIIIKQEDKSIPCKIHVYKTKNGNNIVVHSCIPLGNI